MGRRGLGLVVVLLAVACTGAGDAEKTSTTEPPTSKGGTRAVDLQEVDWASASVPAAVCGGEGTVCLHEGGALVSSSRWSDDWQGTAPTEMPHQVEIRSYGDVQYGDIDGDGHDDAAVTLWCTNGGGTAGGQLGQGLALMSGGSGRMTVLDTVTPTTQGRAGAHAPYFDSSSIRIVDHRLTVEELWYGSQDSNCCPSGRATSTWTYVNGSLLHDETRVTATPTTRP